MLLKQEILPIFSGFLRSLCSQSDRKTTAMQAAGSLNGPTENSASLGERVCVMLFSLMLIEA